MKFKVKYRGKGWAEYTISTGGALQVNCIGGARVWSDHATIQPYFRAYGQQAFFLHPMLVMKTEVLLALALPAVQYIMMNFRKRKVWNRKAGRRYEKADKYLERAWKHVLDRLKTPPYKHGVAAHLTNKRLLASGVLREMKEARHAGR